MACCNLETCACPNKDCPRHGKCCECVNFHRDERNNLPMCLRHLVEPKEESK